MNRPGLDKDLRLTIVAGKDLHVELVHGTKTDGVLTPTDFSGHIITMQVRRSPQSETVIASFTSDGSDMGGTAKGTITLATSTFDEVAGTWSPNVTIDLPASESLKLQSMPGTYVWDTDWDTGASMDVLLEGTANIVAEVTRNATSA